ncbi:MAG: hypothetical protein AABX07_00760 [Nanoarchaeota archaeon]
MELKELKKRYSELEKKYKLPAFRSMNEDFEIEKINLESEVLLRVIRKIMMDKVLSFLNFIERVITNPVGLPRIYYGYVKAMDNNDKIELEKLYDSFGELSLDAFKLEVYTSEKEEAELIKKISRTWQLSKPELIKVAAKMKTPESQVVKKEKSYFG